MISHLINPYFTDVIWKHPFRFLPKAPFLDVKFIVETACYIEHFHHCLIYLTLDKIKRAAHITLLDKKTEVQNIN